MAPQAPEFAIERVARESYGKLVAILASGLRDLTAAEDALSSALLKALACWPETGIPASPEAWLLTVARRRALDERRRSRKDSPLLATHVEKSWAAAVPEGGALPDRRLALLFVCSHPAIDPGSRAPLILQTVLGFEAAQIARAFLVTPAAMAQRLVRAKRKIKAAGIPFSVPLASELAPRLDAVLDAIYACYSEAWSTPPGGQDPRRDLAQEAIWLVRMLVDLCPDEPEAIGLLALVLYLEARSAARRNAAGEYVPLSKQDPACWNKQLIDEAESLLRRAARHGRFGRFQLEAAIQSAHSARRITGTTDWAAILLLYDALDTLSKSPVIAINRAIALGEKAGADAGLHLLAGLLSDPTILDYQPYWAAQADLLARAGRPDEARRAYQKAMELNQDPAIARFLETKKLEIEQS